MVSPLHISLFLPFLYTPSTPCLFSFCLQKRNRQIIILLKRKEIIFANTHSHTQPIKNKKSEIIIQMLKKAITMTNYAQTTTNNMRQKLFKNTIEFTLCWPSTDGHKACS